MRFPVWRELKLFIASTTERIVFGFLWDFPFEGNWNCGSSSDTRHSLKTFYEISRLKGIETSSQKGGCRVVGNFLWDFPFEGNWNIVAPPLLLGASQLSMRFPVWRELKRYSRSNSRSKSDKLSMRFPVWRELKPKAFFWTKPMRYTFYEISRLKGIETSRSSIWRRKPWNFLWDFPFEGNWNAKVPETSMVASMSLSMRFPVWRELKRWIACGKSSKSCHLHFLWDFPFEGNWNIHVIAFPANTPPHFLWDFPFEGNWNL